ncbi:choice-of-anchor M domain-containing protein [Paractinoplanes atraurantiacus]|uniref:Surface-anchored protein n=1 Tax=Paractinoplanes atraurantiacus TaxID=1036182 RepID=A0A285JQ68_9ACTN|nr:choice-of-anchor M domain-containing protein [Actinoplanes atraurantiacus]SNY61466.1 surface-anchored protein [Actinoplanes atraurantiacus]
MLHSLLCLTAAAVLGATPTVPPPAAGQAQARGDAVIESGHIDIGPTLRDGRWSVQIHDDHTVPAVWREPAATVLRIRDTARQAVPDDEAYAFLGEKPGTRVHVVPQTEKPDVVWIGWNTQDPAALKAIDRGVTMNLRGAQGPGAVTVFLQSGNLGAPQVLWSSAKPYPQPIWVEANTHTHANWVFGKPGVYLLALDITAGDASASTVLRLAVGDATDPDDARTAAFTQPLPSGSAAAAFKDSPSRTSMTPFLFGGGALVAALIASLALRQSAVRRRAEKERAAR